MKPKNREMDFSEYQHDLSDDDQRVLGALVEAGVQLYLARMVSERSGQFWLARRSWECFGEGQKTSAGEIEYSGAKE